MTQQPEALRLAAIPIFERSITWQSQATIELRRLHASCEDYAQHKQRQDQRVLELNAQRDALLEALKRVLDRFDPYAVPGFETNVAAEEKARAVIAAMEETK